MIWLLQVSVAQQYLDDLYKLEGINEGKFEEVLAEDMPVPQQSPSGLPFYSSVDVSLGTGEVSHLLKLHCQHFKSKMSKSVKLCLHLAILIE